MIIDKSWFLICFIYKDGEILPLLLLERIK